MGTAWVNGPAIDDNAAGVAARYGRVDLQHARRANQAADLAVTADDARAHGEVQALRGADRGDGLALAWQGGGHAHRLARLAVDQQRGVSVRPRTSLTGLVQDLTGFQCIGSSASRSLLLDPGRRVSTSVR